MFRYILCVSLLITFSLSFPLGSWGKENVPRPQKQQEARKTVRTSSDCLAATSREFLDVNNVRALLHNGGDMWWDLVGNPQYEIPKVDNPAFAKHSLFAGSLWIGGIDGNSQLRLAAQTYRQSGNDYFPGPIRLDDASTNSDICEQWDAHYKIDRVEIDAFRSDFADNGVVDSVQNYPGVFNWPAINPDEGFDRFLAPFVNVDADGGTDYNPENGDYPALLIEDEIVLPDQMIWWVINDRGNIHSETQAQQIGIEIQMTAFAFSTANAINDMTFYKQKVINRSSNTLNDTYIGQWVDADVGFAFDDYVGCDPSRGLGYAYNGDVNDDPPNGYGQNPPAIGVDFFQGPIADEDDGIDNNFNDTIDEPNERIAMQKFVYYENDFSVRGNPSNPSHFYGYLTGFWKNGAPVVDDRVGAFGNGNGFPDPDETNAEPTDFMFPDYPGSRCQGVSLPPQGDPKFIETIAPFDRRFLQSAGPFTLRPGAVNDVITGVVWARDENNSFDNDNLGSVCLLLQVDDIAQALFDNNFDLLDGPDAPDLRITELDEELVLSWDYSVIGEASNNFREDYAEDDPILANIPGVDPTFEFQGYMVYQLLDQTVSAADLDDPDRARLIAQCDLEDGVSTIVNRSTRQVAGVEQPVIVDEIKVQGSDNGLFYSLRVTEDAFADGENNDLVNYRDYYFTIIAYAYNDTSSDGQKFIRGNGNFKRYPAVPHKVEFTNGGTDINSEYGDSPDIVQIAGSGSGGAFLSLTDSVIDQIFVPRDTLINGDPFRFYGINQPVYRADSAPIQVDVIDPREVKPLRYQVIVTQDSVLDTTIAQTGDTTIVFAEWYLIDANDPANPIFISEYAVNLATGDTSPEPLVGTERVIPGHGISVAVTNPTPPGDTLDPALGFRGFNFTTSDPSRASYFPLQDQNDASNFFNWIRSGPVPNCIEGDPPPRGCRDYNNRNYYDDVYRESGNYDPGQVLEGFFGFAPITPYIMSANYDYREDVLGPRLRVDNDPFGFDAPGETKIETLVQLDELPNIDVVITPDSTKWSRCIVVETAPSQSLARDTAGSIGGAPVMAARFAYGRNKDGSISTNPEDLGMGWFPGYAINVDNGQRVNVFFGESSFHANFNGNDMLFNPSTTLINGADKIAYGRHYVYVTNQPYDGCENLKPFLQVGNSPVIQPISQTTRGTGLSVLGDNGDTVRFDSAYKHVAWTTIVGASVLTDFATYEEFINFNQTLTVSARVNRPFEVDPRDSSLPTYQFDMSPLSASVNDREVAEEAVTDLINIVPNPYYGRSGTGRGIYETSQLDTRVKLTNLPDECVIRIMTMNGTLVRTFRKNSSAPNQEWDLKNEFGVPIASGLYVIHVDAGELGEKVLKFFCIMPQVDLNAY